MAKEPIQRRPKVTLPHGWHAINNHGIPYRPTDKPKQEDWYTVARKFGVNVKELIFFNFLTTEPDEVNWYLKHHTKCTKVSPSGNNYMFSGTGYIFIPPAEDRTFTYQEEHLCVWDAWGDRRIEDFLKQLNIVAKSMATNPQTRNRGARVKKLAEVIERNGYPECLKLWYYNDMNVTTFADPKTGESKLREMTKETNGQYPFSGKSGLYDQSGPYERHRGFWQIHPVQELFDKFCGKPWDPSSLLDALVEIDEYMWKGWHALSKIDGIAGGAGGNSYSEIAWNFAKHVGSLSKDPEHLYHAFKE